MLRKFQGRMLSFHPYRSALLSESTRWTKMLFFSFEGFTACADITVAEFSAVNIPFDTSDRKLTSGLEVYKNTLLLQNY